MPLSQESVGLGAAPVSTSELGEVGGLGVCLRADSWT